MNETYNRRNFLKLAGLGMAAVSLPRWTRAEKEFMNLAASDGGRGIRRALEKQD